MELNANNIENANALIDKLNPTKVKYIKKDKGLIERNSIQDEKIILAEDNRQVLLG